MTSMKHLSEDTIMSILDYLNYHDLFHKEKSIISKLFYHNTQKILKKFQINQYSEQSFYHCIGRKGTRKGSYRSILSELVRYVFENTIVQYF